MGDGGGMSNYYFLLDSISVNHKNAGTDVLINGGFETGDFTGWTEYCNTNTNCNGGDDGQVTTSPCFGGYCYMDRCANYDYLVQSFFTVIGDYYKGEKADPGFRDPVDPNGSRWILMDLDGS